MKVHVLSHDNQQWPFSFVLLKWPFTSCSVQTGLPHKMEAYKRHCSMVRGYKASMTIWAVCIRLFKVQSIFIFIFKEIDLHSSIHLLCSFLRLIFIFSTDVFSPILPWQVAGKLSNVLNPVEKHPSQVPVGLSQRLSCRVRMLDIEAERWVKGSQDLTRSI